MTEKRQVKATTPAGSVVTITDAPERERDGLQYLHMRVVNQNGYETANKFISHNVAWAMMRALNLFLPEQGAECTVEIVHEG